MKEFSNLLARISKALGNDQTLKELVVTTIFERLNVALSIEDVTLKEGTLQIRTTPVRKNEIRLHESELLPLLSTRLNLRLTKILYI